MYFLKSKNKLDI